MKRASLQVILQAKDRPIKNYFRKFFWILFLPLLLAGCPNPASPPAPPLELPSLVANYAALTTASTATQGALKADASLAALGIDLDFSGLFKGQSGLSCTTDDQCRSSGYFNINTPKCAAGKCELACTSDSDCDDVFGIVTTCSHDGICQAPHESSECALNPLEAFTRGCEVGEYQVDSCYKREVTTIKQFDGKDRTCKKVELREIVNLINCRRTDVKTKTEFTFSGLFHTIGSIGDICFSNADVSASFPASCKKNSECGVNEVQCLCEGDDQKLHEFASGACTSVSVGQCSHTVPVIQTMATFDQKATFGNKTAVNYQAIGSNGAETKGTYSSRVTATGHVVHAVDKNDTKFTFGGAITVEEQKDGQTVCKTNFTASGSDTISASHVTSQTGSACK